jgi:hypothetical protein
MQAEKWAFQPAEWYDLSVVVIIIILMIWLLHSWLSILSSLFNSTQKLNGRGRKSSSSCHFLSTYSNKEKEQAWSPVTSQNSLLAIHQYLLSDKGLELKLLVKIQSWPIEYDCSELQMSLMESPESTNWRTSKCYWPHLQVFFTSVFSHSTVTPSS